MRDIIGYGGGGGGSSHTHYEATDSLHSTSYARVLDLVSEGEILGLANGVQSVYLNQTPVQNADGTSNFKGVTIDFRSGTQDQDYIAGFPDVESEVAVGTELKYGSPWVHAIGNTQLSAIRITLAVPALQKQDTSNGDVLGYKVDYQIELSTDGGAYQVVLSNSFNGKTTSEYQRTARIDLPTATTGWQIRVTRLTANANTASIADTTTVVSYTEVIDAKLRYPMSAIVGIQVDATQFQSVPTRAYDLFGRIIQVPSNYDPVARTYSGVWDGTFKPAWSNNPTWVFRDLILNDRYGLGDRITAAQVDKWALYKIAQYCDELVPDGKGGTEPRFTCNLYLQTQNQAYAVLQDIASIFRGISYWGAGTIMASSDMPSDPVYIYTAANVIGGKFNRTGSKLSTRYTVALVTWNDPSDFYKQKTEYVEDPEGIARYGIRQASLTGFGCTSQGQAQRAGRWALATSRLETEGLSFDVGMDGAIALPGQVVRIADPSRMGRRMGGRIRAVNGRTLTLDKAPSINVGDQLTAILPSGVSETHAVASVAGDAVTVDADWSTAPVAQSVWSVDSDELSAPLFRVLSVTEKDAATFTITAVQHEPGKYAFVEEGVAITPRTQTALDVTTQAPPASVTLAGYTVSLNDVQKLALQISCAPVAGAVAYEGAYRRGNDNWIAIPRQSSPTMEVLDVLAGNYVATMAAVNSVGISSIDTMSVAVEIAADGASKNAKVDLVADAPFFHTDQDGATEPAVITFTADLTALDGPVSWSCVGGTLTNETATTAQLAFADTTASSATVTASVTVFGRAYSKSLKVGKVQDGAPGTDGLKTATARLYQWAPTAPAKPTGSSTFDWPTLSNGDYTGSDGWSVTVPANPGTPGWRLFAAAVPLSAAASVTTSPVSYTNATIEDGPQNGANGASGVQSAVAMIYQDAATIPAGPVGTSTWTWSSRSFSPVPSGWSASSSGPIAAGMTRWVASVGVDDSADNAETQFNWVGASIGSSGSAGAAGDSYVAAYCVSTVGVGTSAPAPTAGKNSLPPDNSGGLTGTCTRTAPAGDLSPGQYLMIFDGTYVASTDMITWGVPYRATEKVGSLEAVSTNTGNLTFTGTVKSANGKIQLREDGSATLEEVEILNPDGSVMLQAGGQLNPANAAPGTLNSDIMVGGRNLLQDSGFEKGLHPCSTRSLGVGNVYQNGNTDTTPYVGSKFLFFEGGSQDGSDTDIYIYIGGPLASVVPGQTYTLSFYYKSAGALAGSSTFWRLSDGNHIGAFSLNLGNQDTWTRYVTEWTCPAGVSTLEPRFGFHCTGYAWMAVDAIQIEEGNTATAWSAAPEDTAADIAAAQSSADAANTALADKLSRTSASSLAATVTLTTGGSILAGDTTNGTYHSPSGFYGVQGGVVKFSVPISGDPTFGGQLTAPHGTLGSLQIASGGYIATGPFTSYSWPAAGSGPGFFLNSSGILFGNANDGKYFQVVSDGNVYAPGFTIENGQITITQPILINPKTQNSLSVSLAAINYRSQPSGTLTTTSTPTISGATGSISYEWSYSDQQGGGTLTSAPTASTATIQFTGSNTWCSGYLYLTIYDSNGPTAHATAQVTVQFGTGQSNL